MLITAKDYAAQIGVHPRTVKLRLADGKLPGQKILDANGVETWYVDVPDEGGPSKPDHPPVGSDQPLVGSDDLPEQEPSGEDHPPVGSRALEDGPGWVFLTGLIEQLREENQALHRENLELAGRCGFLQNEVIQLREQKDNTHHLLLAAQNRLALLEAPPAAAIAAPPDNDKKPWWRFWA